MSEIKGVIFDMGGVLFVNGYSKFIKELSEKYNYDYKKLYDFMMHDLMYKRGYVRNEITPDEFWESVEIFFKKNLNVDVDRYEWRNKIVSMFTPHKKVFDLIEKLRKKGYNVGVLTDHTDFLYDIDEEHPFLKKFDAYVSSYELGYSKPDREMYDAILEKLDLRPDECIFVDDWEKNTIGARLDDINTILFKNADQLKKDLKSYGVEV